MGAWPNGPNGTRTSAAQLAGVRYSEYIHGLAAGAVDIREYRRGLRMAERLSRAVNTNISEVTRHLTVGH
jgi:hypothetical protein